jgi:hypothetical protein
MEPPEAAKAPRNGKPVYRDGEQLSLAKFPADRSSTPEKYCLTLLTIE